MQCPKCRAPMQTYNRSGVQIEQCSGCRGIFLDYGELESIARMEAQWQQQQAPPPAAPPAQPYPQQQAPAWGAPQHGGHGGYGHGYGHRKGGFGRMLFSS
ncbi:zf-TFIIB domain-containing protein [Streptomyces polyrhachis]|uniref:Zf-TFIIB domain-containing protein n=1 Tax=Streptomyces polyrhachis TaxID=1282885 RepID=A0ABW2GEJ3_9ACTN